MCGNMARHKKTLAHNLEVLDKRAEWRKQAHMRDVAYVQEHYPELAEFLTEMKQAFGRYQYKVTLRHLNVYAEKHQKVK